jgi:uncharacterized membrane protein (DUF2068 family)
MSLESEKAILAAHHHKAPLALRGVAIYEFVKGLLFVAIALGALSLVHKDVGDIAQDIVKRLHLDPAWHYSKLFIEESSKLNDKGLRLLALVAAIFAIVRLVAGYGLWHERPWAEWFAVICAALYVPIEIYHLFERPGLRIAGILIVNIAIIVYLSRLLLANHRRRKAMSIRLAQ